VYVVVDALDECPDVSNARGQLIARLGELQANANVRLLFTSRAIPEIKAEFDTVPTLEVRADEEDVRSFIAGQIPCLLKRIQRDEALKRDIEDKIVESADSMLVFCLISDLDTDPPAYTASRFLVARLHIDSLRGQRTKRDVLSTLSTLPKGLVGLDEAYAKAIDRINGQPPGDRSLAWRTLS
jgi:hypothetical protein